MTLENAAESLCALFLREFEKAAANSDGEKVTRFFKLFPLIGRAQVGLDVYGKYVCGGVSTRARAGLANKPAQDDFFYANAMTRLFEHIATIVEQHGTLVDRHYGKGKMVKVIERLQVEADTQGGIVIDAFMDDRGMDRKVLFAAHSPLAGGLRGARRTAIRPARRCFVGWPGRAWRMMVSSYSWLGLGWIEAGTATAGTYRSDNIHVPVAGASMMGAFSWRRTWIMSGE